MLKKLKIQKKRLIKIFENIKKNGGKIIGYGASAKAVTILNYCNLKENYIDYFMDTTKAKIGKITCYESAMQSLDKKSTKTNIRDHDSCFVSNCREQTCFMPKVSVVSMYRKQS